MQVFEIKRILAAIFLTYFSGIHLAAADDVQAAGPIDYLITGGLVFDGSGGPGERVAIALRGGRIAYIGTGSPEWGNVAHVIDATGMMIAPGFIDPHTHT